MAKFNVTDSDGNTNFIEADEAYVKENYASYSEVVGAELRVYNTVTGQYEGIEKIEERRWRDQELKDTAWIMPVTDHPQHEAYKTYRQKLRDWPSTSDFPDTRPVMG